MDDRIRDLLQRMAEEVGTTPRPLGSLVRGARRRMAVVIVATVTTTALVAAAGIAGVRAITRSAGSHVAPAGTHRSSGPPTPAPTGASPSPAEPAGPGEIAFVSNRSGNWDVYVMAADGSAITNLTSNPADDITPAWSPDGARIAFASDRSGTPGGTLDLYVMNADGSGVTQLTHNTPGVQYSSPAWSPDGTQIAFMHLDGTAGEIWVMDAEGSNQHVLVAEPRGDVHPAWSPDGTEIAFLGYGGRIASVHPDGSGLRFLTDGPQDTDPAWSPDGALIAFVRIGPSGGGVAPSDVFLVGTDGSTPTPLTDDGLSSLPAWSPDGTWIAFTRYEQGARDDIGDVYLMSASGTGVTQLTNGPADDEWPSWRP